MSTCSTVGDIFGSTLGGLCKKVGDVKDAIITPDIEKKIGNIKDILMKAGSCVWDKTDVIKLGGCIAADIPMMAPVLTGPYLTGLLAQCSADKATQDYVQGQLAELFGKSGTGGAGKPGGGADGKKPRPVYVQTEARKRAEEIVDFILYKQCDNPVPFTSCRPGYQGKGIQYSSEGLKWNIPASDKENANGYKIQELANRRFIQNEEMTIKAIVGAIDDEQKQIIMATYLVDKALQEYGVSMQLGSASTKSKQQKQAYLVKAGMGIAAGVAALVLAIYIGKQLKKA